MMDSQQLVICRIHGYTECGPSHTLKHVTKRWPRDIKG